MVYKVFKSNGDKMEQNLPCEDHTVKLYPQLPGTTDYPPGPVPMIAFGPTPQTIICPSCHCQTITTVKSKTTSKTHVMAALLCLLCCCCCLPYCMDCCKNKHHYCQHCGAFLGSYVN